MIASAFGALSRWVLERALPRKRARAERPDPARDDVDDDDVEDSSHAPKKQKITVAKFLDLRLHVDILIDHLHAHTPHSSSSLPYCACPPDCGALFQPGGGGIMWSPPPAYPP